MSRTYTIRHQDTRGIATLVGFVGVLILSRLWWTGALEGLLTAAYQPQGEALTSTTYVVLSFAANLIYGIGTVLVAAWSGLWWLVADITARARSTDCGAAPVASQRVAQRVAQRDCVSRRDVDFRPTASPSFVSDTITDEHGF